MGEIRSTLDIIMEKTKGLTMSDEEKKAFKEQEMARQVRGLIQKYLDGILELDRLKIEAGALAGTDEDMVRGMIRKESIPRIEPGENNEPILRILEETTGLDTVSIRAALEDFEGRLEQEKGVREKELIKSLEKKGISGSAVIPNIHADPEWTRYVLKVKEEFQERVTSYMQKT
ncbi:MAG: hypothetical protein PVH82_09110 [Desulfobacteraceae bacterium]|jgi:hypothetical protein